MKVEEFLEDFGLEQENNLVENFYIDLTKYKIIVNLPLIKISSRHQRYLVQ